MSAKELKEDEFRDRFEAGESLESLGFDLDKALIDEPAVKRVNVDFPDAVVAKLDRHCALMGITRQSLIKVWIFERLKEEEAAKAAIVDQMHGSSLLQTVQKLRTGRELTLREISAILAEPPTERRADVKKRRTEKSI